MFSLNDLQNKELEILLAVHKACEELNLKYTIGHGTLLGAIRHKGFIPWDDDIDICMPRKDYERFILEASNYLPENYKLQHYSIEIECPNVYLKVRDSNTTYLHKEHVDYSINQGVFIDIFPIDRIYNNSLLNRYEFFRRRLFNIINACYDSPYVESIQQRSKRIIAVIIHFLIKTNIVNRNMSRNDFLAKEDKRRVSVNSLGGESTFISIERNITGPFNLFINREKYLFESYYLYGPKDYDAILKRLYGDYMTIPPIDKQVNHRPLFVDLSRSYTKDELNKIINEL